MYKVRVTVAERDESVIGATILILETQTRKIGRSFARHSYPFRKFNLLVLRDDKNECFC